MSSKILLLNILKKAHANGYRCKSANTAYESFSVIDFDSITEQFSLKLTCPATTSVFHSSLSVLVSDSNFINAFFGNLDELPIELTSSVQNKLTYLEMELDINPKNEVKFHDSVTV